MGPTPVSPRRIDPAPIPAGGLPLPRPQGRGGGRHRLRDLELYVDCRALESTSAGRDRTEPLAEAWRPWDVGACSFTLRLARTLVVRSLANPAPVGREEARG